MKPIYRRSPGFHISQKDAVVIGEAFTKIERRLRRPVHEEDIVSAAVDAASPLHRFFEWDDSLAARKYRLWQAHRLLMSVDVILPEHGDLPVRMAIPVDFKGGGFMSTAKAATSSPDVIARQVERARDDAKMIVERYQAWIAFAEFEPVAEFVVAAKRLIAST